MMFSNVLGHDFIKAYLVKALKTNTLPHAILFTGVSGIGKSILARELAAYLLQTTYHKISANQHPDFHEIRPQSKNGYHCIDSLREFIQEVHNAPFSSSGKVFLIHDADRMQDASANAILKTLEEPSLDTTILLLAEKPQDILPTIRSRTSQLNCKPLSLDLVQRLLEEKKLDPSFALFADGSIGKAIELSSKPMALEPLFSLLSEKKPYYKLTAELELLEASLSDEDPIVKNQNVERLFCSILMWYRDQVVLHLAPEGACLYFSESKKVTLQPPKMEKLFRLVDDAYQSYLRNIKLSVCLEPLFS